MVEMNQDYCIIECNSKIPAVEITKFFERWIWVAKYLITAQFFSSFCLCLKTIRMTSLKSITFFFSLINSCDWVENCERLSWYSIQCPSVCIDCSHVRVVNFNRSITSLKISETKVGTESETTAIWIGSSIPIISMIPHLLEWDLHGVIPMWIPHYECGWVWLQGTCNKRGGEKE